MIGILDQSGRKRVDARGERTTAKEREERKHGVFLSAEKGVRVLFLLSRVLGGYFSFY